MVRSSGSVHANFIESVEAISKKDSLHRIKICRKESKESRSWLRLADISRVVNLEQERASLIGEAIELMRVFGAIISKKNSFKS